MFDLPSSPPHPSGSGGNNHAVEHYEQLKYPLAVKLGTITPDGADVHSYDEDEMVEDPQLAKHLAHFGINIASMTKVSTDMLFEHVWIRWTVSSHCRLEHVH